MIYHNYSTGTDVAKIFSLMEKEDLLDERDRQDIARDAVSQQVAFDRNKEVCIDDNRVLRYSLDVR